jgi:serine phosphatase RsbU (regulator of sigma subunit)
MSRYATQRDDDHRERDAAHLAHQRLTASAALRVPGVAITGHSQTVGPVGGDWWLASALPDGRVFFAVGDVTGHDLAAAFMACTARGIVDGAVRVLGAAATPARVMATLDAALASLGELGREMTCVVLVLDPMLGRLDLASAGHPFPLVRRARGTLDVVVARGAPLGSATSAMGLARTELQPGDLVFVSTDGLADRAGDDGRRFGERRLRRLLRDHTPAQTTNVHRLRADILAALRGFATVTAADDDLTMVVCEFRAHVLDGVESRGEALGAVPEVCLDHDVSAAFAAAMAIDDSHDTAKILPSPAW